MKKLLKGKLHLYLFILPTFIFLIIFCYYPTFSALYHSFFEWDGVKEKKFIGFENFINIFKDEVIRESSVNLIKLLIFSLVVSIIPPLFGALLIYKLKSEKLQYLYRVLFVIPMVVPGLIIVLVWGFIYDSQVGILNNLFGLLGLEKLKRFWLSDPKIALYAIMFIGFPFIGGFNLLIFYAGLRNIPVSILESAEIDGAEGVVKFFYIELPLIMGQMKLIIILTIIGGLQNFLPMLVLTNGGPGYSTMVPALYMYFNALNFSKMGYACAIGTIIFTIIFIFTYLNMKYIKSNIEYEVN